MSSSHSSSSPSSSASRRSGAARSCVNATARAMSPASTRTRSAARRAEPAQQGRARTRRAAGGDAMNGRLRLVFVFPSSSASSSATSSAFSAEAVSEPSTPSKSEAVSARLRLEALDDAQRFVKVQRRGRRAGTPSSSGWNSANSAVCASRCVGHAALSTAKRRRRYRWYVSRAEVTAARDRSVWSAAALSLASRRSRRSSSAPSSPPRPREVRGDELGRRDVPPVHEQRRRLVRVQQREGATARHMAVPIGGEASRSCLATKSKTLGRPRARCAASAPLALAVQQVQLRQSFAQGGDRVRGLGVLFFF